jgi:hypothetical protein
MKHASPPTENGSAVRNLQPDGHTVLAKALTTAGRDLGLTQAQVGGIIGRDRTALSRAAIDPSSKSGELGLLLIRVYRALFVLVGGDVAQMRHWLHTHNHHLEDTPARMLGTVQGLMRVVEYLDAIRGKL